MDTIKIVCIGHTTLDDIVISETGDTYFRQPGGGGLHSAAGAALWSSRKQGGVVTRLPGGIPPAHRREMDRLPSLDMEGACQTDETGLKLWLLYEDEGYRQWVTHHNSSTREQAAPRPEQIPERYLRQAAGYHIAPLPLPSVEALLTRLPQEAVLQIDPHYDWFFPQYRGRWQPVLQRTHVLLPSEDEFAKFFGIPYGQEPECYVPYVRELLSMGPRVVVLKMGARGALLATAREPEIWLVPSAARQEDIVDFTGAGDSFCGSFLFHYVDGMDPLDCAVRGAVTSSLVMEGWGVLSTLRIPQGTAEERLALVQEEVRRGIQRIV